jgi:alkylation response protein AidB-like acyl-CoA dehydrogenase
MNFDFSDEQEQLRDALRRWVDKSYTFERRRAIVKGGGFDTTAWEELAGLGLTGLMVPTAHGGLGLGPVDAMVVMEELGRGLVLEPFAAVALVATHLLAQARTPVAATWLQRLAEGSARVVLAQQERGTRYDFAHVRTRAESSSAGGPWVLSGHKSLVPAGAHAGAFVVPARVRGEPEDPDGIGLFLVEAGTPGVATRPYALQDGSAAADLSLARAAAIELLPPGEAFSALEAAVDAGLAALCAEAVGVMDQLMAVTVEYMNTRKQFGVAIASFQALRHRVADMKMQLELARSMSYYATLRLGDAPEQRRRAVSQAKVQLGQAMRFVGQQAIQLHGGIGVTDEYIASHYFKRLTCIELSFGDTLHHLGEVAERMQDTAGVFA